MDIFGNLSRDMNGFINPFDIEKKSLKMINKEDSKDSVSIRYTSNTNGKTVKLVVYLGLNVCDNVGFKEKDQVSLLLRKDGNSIMVVKENLGNTYNLYHASKGNSLIISFTYPFSVDLNDFRLNRTIATDFVCNKNKNIIVNLSPLLIDKDFYATYGMGK